MAIAGGLGSRRQQGFTLIELLVVVVIIASIGIPNFLTALQRGRQRRTMMDMRSLSTAVETYKIDFSRPPQATGAPSLVSILQPLYIAQLPQTDAWYNNLGYQAAAESYTLESFGRDGLDGADITPTTSDQFDLDIVLFDGVFVNTPD